MRKSEQATLFLFFSLLLALINLSMYMYKFRAPITMIIEVGFTHMISLFLIGMVFLIQNILGLSGKWVFPPLLAVIYLSFSPLVHYQSIPFYSDDILFNPAFYAQCWFQLLITLLILILGYGLLFLSPQ
ncbi:hypothetical protein JCM19233_5556 [Vibrio astriarenae]|nr:hypothetical protein JCM19233_5556 [Vibrio sp. C7]